MSAPGAPSDLKDVGPNEEMMVILSKDKIEEKLEKSKSTMSTRISLMHRIHGFAS